jgi:anti-sigma regulatory factor (Ser/Thr protein kinase)
MLPRLHRVVPQNVVDICSYGFNEILNNVVDHSESDECFCYMDRDAVKVRFGISDEGVGIFEKIQKAFDLADRRHALLELSKGKLTTDASKHTGEGIFFTSRMMDNFSIGANELYYSKDRGEDGWLIGVKEQPDDKGTLVTMHVKIDAKHTAKDVFDEFSTVKTTGLQRLFPSPSLNTRARSLSPVRRQSGSWPVWQNSGRSIWTSKESRQSARRLPMKSSGYSLSSTRKSS